MKQVLITGGLGYIGKHIISELPNNYGKTKLINERYLNDLASYFDLLYFSIITQTTVGYGDIIPYSRKSKTLVILQILTSLVILELSFDDWF